MVLQLTSMKIAWMNSRTKPFTALTPKQSDHKTDLKYLARPHTGGIEAVLCVQPALLFSNARYALSAPHSQ